MKRSKRSEISGAYHSHMNTGKTREERAAIAKAAAEERSHIRGGNYAPTPLSELGADSKRGKGLSPQARAAQRGVTNPPAKRLPWSSMV
jgi:hypothetical protein